MKPTRGVGHRIVMQGSSAPAAPSQRFPHGLLVALLIGSFVGCIDDRPSGPGRIRNGGGAANSGGLSNLGGSTSAGGTTSSSQSAGAGGSTSAGGATSSSQSASAGGSTNAGGAPASSQTAGSGGTTGRGGATASSQTTGSGGATGRGGATASSQPAGTGGRNGTGGTTSGNRDAGAVAPPPRDSGPPADSAAPTDAASVSFANQILPLLKANCVSCHGSSQQNAGVRLDSYTVVKTNLTAAADAISRGIMPPTGGLTTAQRQLFQSWVNQGAPNN
jgi:hypothetical protein